MPCLCWEYVMMGERSLVQDSFGWRRARTRGRKRDALRLRLERLESRNLLAGGLQNSWDWFETFEEVPRVNPSELDSPSQFSATVMGPRDLVVAEWIVQLTAEASGEVHSLDSIPELIDRDPVNFRAIAGLGSPGLVLLRGRGVSRLDMQAVLEASADVASFDANSLLQGQATTPNEPDFQAGLLPGLVAIDAPGAWDNTRGSLSVVVGVVDTGVDPTHPDLYLNIWLNQGEIPDAIASQLVDIDGDNLITFYDLNNVTIDATTLVVGGGDFASGPNSQFVTDKNGNGRIDALDLLADARWADGRDTDDNSFFDDLFGVNFRSGEGDPFQSNNPSDGLGHGTHVAGTIGAVGNNGIGVSGVNWQTSLMSLRILDNNNQADAGAAIRAVNYATGMRNMFRSRDDGTVVAGANVRVLNNSWGQPGGFERSLEVAIRESGDAGILFVAAAGNGNILGNGVNNDLTAFYPASYDLDNVVAVAALSNSGELASFSNFGAASVDIGAPGVGIRSTLPGRVTDTGQLIDGGYGLANGTSMAAPHVAGTAALIWAALPQSTVEDVRTALLSSTAPLSVATGTDPLTLLATGGQLDANGALTADVYAPSVELLGVADVTTSGGTSNEITIRFAHPIGIDPLSIGDGDLVITRLWGPSQQIIATLKVGSVITESSGFTATYLVQAPGGNWDPIDFGDYDISVAQGAVVSSNQGVANRAERLGSFRVQIPDPAFFYVDTTVDSQDSVLGDGIAVDALGRTSLRAATQEANQRSQADPLAQSFIILEQGIYDLSIAGVGEDFSGQGDLDIRGTTSILGDSRSNVQIVASHRDRVFDVPIGGKLSLERVSIIGGQTVGDGGGVLVGGRLDANDVELTNNVAARGAAIAVAGGGFLSLTGSSAVELNRSTNTDVPGNRRVGGAIFFDSLSRGQINGATIASNITDGIAQLSSGSDASTRDEYVIDVFNTTVSGNAENGLYLQGAVNLDHATIVANGRFGINFYSGETGFTSRPGDGQLLSIRNSIILQNATDSLSLTVEGGISDGFNIVQDDSFGDIGSVVINDPTDLLLLDTSGVVSPLDFYGTSTRHHPLAINSPAIDAATTTLLLDQFGSPRPVDGDANGSSAPDVGAIEASADQVVTGRLFDDRNGDAQQDAGEVGVSGQVLFLDLDNDGELGPDEPVTTSREDDPRTPSVNEQGTYLFTQASNQPITVVLLANDEWVISEPALQRLSETRAGVGGNSLSGARIPILDDQAISLPPAISETGRFVGFASRATNLEGTAIDRGRGAFGDPNTTFLRYAANGDAFGIERDLNDSCYKYSLTRQDGTVQEIGNPVLCGQFVFEFDSFAITPDGSVRAYFQQTPFGIVVESSAGTTLLDDAFTSLPTVALSQDGKVISYSIRNSQGTELIKRVNLDAGSVSTITVGTSGEQPLGDSRFPSLSADGTVVVFESEASNLVPDDNNFSSDIFLSRNGEIERISLPNDLAEKSGNSVRPTISSDGKFVAFASEAQLDPIDGNGVSDIYVYSVEAKEVKLVTRSTGGVAANGKSDVPSLSADGRYVVFASNATNLIEKDENGFTDVFLATNPFLGVLENGFGNAIAVSGQQQAAVDFALVSRPGRVSGIVYEDVLNNGVFDQGEIGFPGATVYLDLDRNGIRDEGEPIAVTDDGGNYLLRDVASNRDYSVAVEAPLGFVQVPLAGNALNHELFLPAGTNITGRDFGFRLSAGTGQSGGSSISGRIYDDVNGDGVFNSGDIPLAAAEVFLDSQNPGVRDVNEPRVLTDSEGQYRFDGLGNRIVAVSTILDESILQASPLGNQFKLDTFPLFDEVQPFGKAQAIATGDFNGDSFPDVAVALAEANMISIRLNDGQGEFLPDEIDINLGVQSSGPTSLVIGDFNSSGGIDMAVTANLSGNVTVLLDFDGQGFASTSRVAVGMEPIDLVAGRIDSNGSLDLVVVNKADDTIVALLNDGLGGFTPGPPIPTGGNAPVSIVVGKFDGDEFLDAAVVHGEPSNSDTINGDVAIFRGNGNGGFVAEPVTYPVGAIATDLVVADFNGDQRDDLAVSNFGSNTIVVLTANGDGTFTTQASVLGTASGAFDIAVADIDNDDDIDIVASNLVNRNISVFRNVGVDNNSVRFEPLENVGLGQFSFAQRMPLAIANFDNDTSGPNGSGTQDIVTVPRKTDTLHVLLNELVDGGHRVALTGNNQIVGLDFITKPAVIPPAIDSISGATLDEDASEQTVSLTGIRPGRADGPPLRIVATSSNLGLIAAPIVAHVAGNSTATLTYTPLANANGRADIDVTVTDAGADRLIGTADDAVVSRSFSVDVIASNDAPDFNFADGVVTVPQESGAQTIAGFVGGITPGGGTDELVQNLSEFSVTAEGSFFSVAPAIDRQGQLTFTPSAGASGTVLVQVQISDDGGTANQGSDTKIASFAISISNTDPQSIVLSGSGNTFFLTQPDSQLDGIQLIDIRGVGNNTLMLNADRIRDVFAESTIRVISDSDDTVVFDGDWEFVVASLADGQLVRQFTRVGAVVDLVGPDDFTNPISEFDVNGSGNVSSVDALQIINELSRRRFSDDRSNPVGEVRDPGLVDLDLFRFYDVTRDSRITALDALRVINELARQSSSSGSPEGESMMRTDGLDPDAIDAVMADSR